LIAPLVSAGKRFSGTPSKPAEKMAETRRQKRQPRWERKPTPTRKSLGKTKGARRGAWSRFCRMAANSYMVAVPQELSCFRTGEYFNGSHKHCNKRETNGHNTRCIDYFGFSCQFRLNQCLPQRSRHPLMCSTVLYHQNQNSGLRHTSLRLQPLEMIGRSHPPQRWFIFRLDAVQPRFNWATDVSPSYSN